MATHSETIGEEKVGKAKPGGEALHCIVVTPERTWLDEVVDSVVLPAFDGEVGVLRGHSPMIARLGHGELRTKLGGTVHRYFVDGGFAQVRDDVVTILTHRAIPADQVDATSANKDLERAEDMPSTSEHEFEVRERAFARARGMIRVARSKR